MQQDPDLDLLKGLILISSYVAGFGLFFFSVSYCNWDLVVLKSSSVKVEVKKGYLRQ